MIGTVGIWNLLLTGEIIVGIMCVAVLLGLWAWLDMRERKDRPLLPWGARMRAERSRALLAHDKAELEREALEVKRLAISHQRTRVLAAIENDDHEAVQQLGLPSGNGKVEEGLWAVPH